jgi:hypothetical protein
MSSSSSSLLQSSVFDEDPADLSDAKHQEAIDMIRGVADEGNSNSRIRGRPRERGSSNNRGTNVARRGRAGSTASAPASASGGRTTRSQSRNRIRQRELFPPEVIVVDTEEEEEEEEENASDDSEEEEEEETESEQEQEEAEIVIEDERKEEEEEEGNWVPPNRGEVLNDDGDIEQEYKLNPLFRPIDPYVIRVPESNAYALLFPKTSLPSKPGSKKNPIQIDQEIARMEKEDFALQRIVFLDFEVHNTAPSKRICQIACISLDAKLVFNRYIYWAPLFQHWQDLVDQHMVLVDPWHDPKKSQHWYDMLNDLCDVYPDYSIFVFHGTTDYSWFLKNCFLYREHPLREPILAKLAAKRYKFARIGDFFADPWLEKEEARRYHSLASALKLKKSKLGTQYDAFFYHSLLWSNASQTFLYSQDIGMKVEMALAASFPLVSIQEIEKNALASNHHSRKNAGVYMPFWTNKHLQPLTHFAHTDVQMLRDIVLAFLLFLDVDDSQDDLRDAEQRFAETMTALVVQTTFFRGVHLTCPPLAAQFLYSKLAQHHLPINAGILQIYVNSNPPIYTPNSLRNNPSYTERPIGAFHAVSPAAPEFRMNPHAIQGDEKEMDKKNVRADHRVRVYISTEGSGVAVAVRRPVFSKGLAGGKWATKVDAMRTMIHRQHLPINGIHNPFAFNPFVQETDRVSLENADGWDFDPSVGDRPWYVILSQVGESYPKTMVLHCRKCPALRDPQNPERCRPAYKSDLFRINFYALSKTGQWPQMPFYFKFHKECIMHASLPQNSIGPQLARRAPAPIGQPLRGDVNPGSDDDGPPQQPPPLQPGSQVPSPAVAPISHIPPPSGDDDDDEDDDEVKII